MNLELLIVPFDTARRDWRMGAGPEHLLAGGLVSRLEHAGHAVTVTSIAPADDRLAAEIATAFALMRELSRRVREAVSAGRFPLVLSGNCNTATGTLSGLTPRKRAVFWFDAHGDVNTPETTTSGFLDGMALSTALGWCWGNLTATVAGFEPVDPGAVFLLGARDLDPPEHELIQRARIRVISAVDSAASELAPVLHGFPEGAIAYVHCDLDVLDPRFGRVNPFPVSSGLDVEAVEASVRRIAAAMPIGAAAVTAYAPQYDVTGSVRESAFRIVDTIVGAAGSLRIHRV